MSNELFESLPRCGVCDSRPVNAEPTKCSNASCPFSLDTTNTTIWRAQHTLISSRIPEDKKLQPCHICFGKNPDCSKCHGWNLSPGLSDVMLAMEPYAGQDVSVAELAQVTGKSSSWVSHKLGKLAQAGHVVRKFRGVFRLSPSRIQS